MLTRSVRQFQERCLADKATPLITVLPSTEKCRNAHCRTANCKMPAVGNLTLWVFWGAHLLLLAYCGNAKTVAWSDWSFGLCLGCCGARILSSMFPDLWRQLLQVSKESDTLNTEHENTTFLRNVGKQTMDQRHSATCHSTRNLNKATKKPQNPCLFFSTTFPNIELSDTHSAIYDSDGRKNPCKFPCKLSGFLFDPKKRYCQNWLKFQNTKFYGIDVTSCSSAWGWGWQWWGWRWQWWGLEVAVVGAGGGSSGAHVAFVYFCGSKHK